MAVTELCRVLDCSSRLAIWHLRARFRKTVLERGNWIQTDPKKGWFTILRLAANYLAFIKLASIRIWLRVYEFTP